MMIGVIRSRIALLLTRRTTRWVLALMLAFTASTLGSMFVAAQGDQNRAALGDEASAVAVLGRPLPMIHDTDSGLTRSAIGIDPPMVSHRSVHVSYAIAGVNVALLTIERGVITPLDTEETLTTTGASISVASHVIRDGTTDVGYAWTDGKFSFVLHVNLRGTITRQAADRIALSVR